MSAEPLESPRALSGPHGSQGDAGPAAGDPQALLEEARRWARAYHRDALHLERTHHWTLVLEPDAGEALQLAAMLHDIERAFPDSAAAWDPARHADRADYSRYHQDRSAAYVEAWLEARDADPAVTAEATRLVAVHEDGGWAAADVLQAADSLSFLEVMGWLVRDWIVRVGRPRAFAEAKLRQMYDRMRLDQARRLGGPLLRQRLADIDWVVRRG